MKILVLVKNSWLYAPRGFTDLLSNLPKRSPRISLGYKNTENMFHSLISKNGNLPNVAKV